MFKRSVLKNGLRLVTVSTPHLPTVGINVVIKSGSRYENPRFNGISHFLEHMCFIGTHKWPTKKALMTAVEGTGGIINAETRKESTSFWVKTRKEYFERAMEIILDMVINPKLDSYSIEKEKEGVVAQINRRIDFPHQYCLDLLFKTAWPNHPLGQNTLGDRNTISKITQQVLSDYKNRFYTPENTVISVAGDIPNQKITESLNKYISDLKDTPEIFKEDKCIEEDQINPQLNIVPKDTKQVYLALGIRAFSNQNPDKFSLQVIKSLLGTGFSSRLYLSLREEKNLVFSPQAFVSLFQDTGLFIIQAQVEKDKLEEALEALMKEMVKIKKKKVGSGELGLAKEKLKGRILFSLETPERLAEWYGTQELLQSKSLTISEMFGQIDSVTSQNIQRVAGELFVDKNLNLVLVGPVTKNKRIAEKLTFGNP